MPTPSSVDQLREASSLPEWVTPYLAALIDNHASLVVSVARASGRGIGYLPKQELRYKGGNRAVFDLLELYCAEREIEPRITELSDTTYQRFNFVLSSRSDIVAFLTPLRPYLVVQDRAVSLLVETLIPGLNHGAHTDEESFLAWVRILQAFREEVGRANRAKYDYEFFCDELDANPDQINLGSFEWINNDTPPRAIADESKGNRTSAIDTLEGVSETDDSPQWIVPYVAALVDVHFDFVIKIGEQESRAVGYKIDHSLEYKAEGESIIHLLEQFLAELGIEPRIQERDETTYEHYELIIGRRDDITTLLEAVRPYLLVRNEAVRILIDEILPAMNAGAHSERDTFVELMGDIEAFREGAGRANRAEYDQDYFRDEWEVDSA
jgi:nitrogen regulatory protein PII